jgi:predicted ATPase
MNKRKLDSFEIKNFRTFQHLCIPQLGHVNLVVGKNNVGKSCLLEALRLYAQRGDPTVIWDILELRDEIGAQASRDATDEPGMIALGNLFYGRPDISAIPEPIELGPCDQPDQRLAVGVGWYASQVNGQGPGELKPLQPDEYQLVENPRLHLTIQFGQKPQQQYLSVRRRNLRFPPRLPTQELETIFVGAKGLERTQISTLWDNIAISDLEMEILTALRIIAPSLERLSVVGDQEVQVGGVRRLERIPIVRLAGNPKPVPLKSLGEGMNRMFGIALALVNAKNGILLFDEIESGLHYSVQLDMWRLVFELANRLNVQVFATTHSWDCIAAFQIAAQEATQEGILVRLGSKNHTIVATLFQEDELAIVTQDQIEVR